MALPLVKDENKEKADARQASQETKMKAYKDVQKKKKML